jgi:hypothetical protein
MLSARKVRDAFINVNVAGLSHVRAARAPLINRLMPCPKLEFEPFMRVL